MLDLGLMKGPEVVWAGMRGIGVGGRKTRSRRRMVGEIVIGRGKMGEAIRAEKGRGITVMNGSITEGWNISVNMKPLLFGNLGLEWSIGWEI